MRYGFTASRSYDPHGHRDIVTGLLRCADIAGDDDLTFNTGGCRGGDRAVGTVACELYPDARHVVYVPADRSQVDAWWEEEPLRSTGPVIELVFCPPGTDYRYRNEQIVEDSDRVVALPYRRLDRPRSGTRMTANIARRAGKLWRVEVLP